MAARQRPCVFYASYLFTLPIFNSQSCIFFQTLLSPSDPKKYVRYVIGCKTFVEVINDCSEKMPALSEISNELQNLLKYLFGRLYSYMDIGKEKGTFLLYLEEF